MTILTTIPNGASNKDIRDTWNSMLSRLTALDGGLVVVTPTVTISGAVSHAEGNSGTTAFLYTVTRSSSVGAVSVPWTFNAGSTNGADYPSGTVPVGGNVTMADGVLTGTITINVVGDTTVEPDEMFTVSITAPAGYAAGTSMSATGTIVNDDVGLVFDASRKHSSITLSSDLLSATAPAGTDNVLVYLNQHYAYNTNASGYFEVTFSNISSNQYYNGIFIADSAFAGLTGAAIAADNTGHSAAAAYQQAGGFMRTQGGGTDTSGATATTGTVTLGFRIAAGVYTTIYEYLSASENTGQDSQVGRTDSSYPTAGPLSIGLYLRGCTATINVGGSPWVLAGAPIGGAALSAMMS